MLKAADVFSGPSEIRSRILDLLAALTPEQLEWAPPGSRNSIAYYLRHMAQSEDWFLTAWINGQPSRPKRRAELSDFAAMRAYLEETRARTQAYLEATDAAALTARRPGWIEGFPGQPREFVTVGWVLTRVFQHETYHLGQVQLLLRLQGLEPALPF